MTTFGTNVDLRASQQHVTLRATIPFMVLAVIAVICRFIARRIQNLRLEFDDYMSLAGLIFTLGCFSLSMEMTHLGSGKHLVAVPVGNIPQYFKVSQTKVCAQKKAAISDRKQSASSPTSSCTAPLF